MGRSSTSGIKKQLKRKKRKRFRKREQLGIVYSIIFVPQNCRESERAREPTEGNSRAKIDNRISFRYFTFFHNTFCNVYSLCPNYRLRLVIFIVSRAHCACVNDQTHFSPRNRVALNCCSCVCV